MCLVTTYDVAKRSDVEDDADYRIGLLIFVNVMFRIVFWLLYR